MSTQQDALRQVGAMMANTMFNLAQKAGYTLYSDDCALFDSMRKQWDAALASQPAEALAGQGERERFEEWATDQHCGFSFEEINGVYVDDPTQCAWLGYQAALAQPVQAPAVPEGYVLVPIEPTDAMVLAGAISRDSSEFPNVIEVYRAMVAAAPTAQPKQESAQPAPASTDLERQNAELRAALEALVDCISETRGKDAAEALQRARDLLSSQPAANTGGHVVQVPINAYLWLMGMGRDSFTEDREGAFWWRSAFNERAGLDMVGIYEASKRPTPNGAGNQEGAQ